MRTMLELIKNYSLYFFVGGTVTTLIVAAEQADSRMLSGVATLMPVFTLVAYFFIGETRGGAAVGQHALLVLVGTLVSWVPYMMLVAVLAPNIGSRKAIAVGLAAFFVLAISYIAIVNRMGWFLEKA